ncbi:hypothetical protein CBS9595_003447 [Malassezia furfur]|nr:hypothetical protein CBS9595_003447 [Malassezia furfur]
MRRTQRAHLRQWWQRSGLGAAHLLHQRRAPVERFTVRTASGATSMRGAADVRSPATTYDHALMPARNAAAATRTAACGVSRHTGTITSATSVSSVQASSASTPAPDAWPSRDMVEAARPVEAAHAARGGRCAARRGWPSWTLAIRGVRSFDPKAVHIIQFFKPLTVIVGHNGSGKTVRAPLTQTIVECLKYAATGDLPPNTKGGAFVHDPALANTDTVKAQVRLRFRNTHGVRMSCVRNVQVSRKRTGALTLKTLEGVLGVDDDAVDAQTRAAISTRCAELDQEMAHLLGVSRAILEHVVFCHQEESNWPLAEPAVLKKRFDEIFEVTRYTKALDALKALRKQRQQDARVDDAELRALQHDKERADAVQRTLDTLDATIAQKTRDVEALEAELASRTAANDALRDAAAQFREVLARAAALEERRALYADTAAELRRSTTLLDAPVAELEARLAALPATLAAAAAERDAAHARLADAQRARTDADAAHEALVRQQGAHAAAAQTLARLRRDAHAELVAIAARHGLAAHAGDTEALAAATLAALRAHVRTADAADDHAADDARTRLDALEHAVQQRRSALRDVQAQHTHAAAALARLDARVAQADADLGGAPAAAPAVDGLRTRRDTLAAQVRDAGAAQARADADAQCRALEARRDALSRTLAASASAVAARAALAEREQQHAARAAELAARTAALATDAARLATDGTPAGIAAAAAAALADAERAEAEADAAAQAAARAADRAAAALDVHDAQAAERDAQCAALRAADTYAGDLAHDLRAARDEVQLRDESLATLEHAAAFFARILAQGRERHVCLACDRALPDAALPAFEAHVRASMQRSTPERVAAGRHRDEARVADLAASLRAAAADVPGDGAALDAALAEAQARRAACDAAVAAAERAAHTHAEAVRGAQATEAQLRDSVRCAQLERDAARAAAELRALDVAGAQAQRDAYDARYDAARRAETAQRGDAAHLRGELRGLADERARRAAELATDYAEVHARYVKQLVHIKVARLADADLETYCGALHQAILQYHAIKMEEVNQTLDYLWKKTYQGTDIDTVLVRSDADGRVGPSGLRSYQYRVCMVKDRVELDMRGRCSAGQKVLACILVRLALADAFGAHCGFLALDEPTTNLDRENVEALAASLVDLIAERRHQRNFQLVVITHDEDFLTRLAQSDALTQYWRVSRDAHLHSVLERATVRRL